MFEPLTQTVSQLAVRWRCSAQDVLTHAMERNWPLYFQFDGLVFDVGDTDNRAGGNSKQVEGAARLQAEIDSAESTLVRNSLHLQGRLKLTEWEAALTSDEMCELRKATDSKKMMLAILSRALTQWSEDRRGFQRNGALRAAPLTLQAVAERGTVPFPIKAFHPDGPVHLVRELDEAGESYQGRMVALEDMRHFKESLTADDLFATMADINAIESAYSRAYQPVSPPAVPTPPESAMDATAPVHVGSGKMKKAAMVQKFRNEWPTLEGDIDNASRSELKVAQLGSGFYDIDKAIKWARENGKFHDSAGPRSKVNSIYDSVTSVKKRID
jgi:hypothetical protein